MSAQLYDWPPRRCLDIPPDPFLEHRAAIEAEFSIPALVGAIVTAVIALSSAILSIVRETTK